MILGGCWVSFARSSAPFSSSWHLPPIMKLLGQPSSVWRLMSRLWNLRVKISLCYLKPDFVGRLSVSKLSHCHARNMKRLAKMNNRGSATPNIASQNRSGMGLSPTTMMEQRIDQTNLSGKGVVAGSIPAGLPHFNIRRNG